MATVVPLPPATRPGPDPSRIRARPVVVLGIQALCVAWVSLLAGLTFWATAPMLLGMHPRVVLSGSMQPRIQPGDIVGLLPVGDPSSVQAPRVLAVSDPGLPSGGYVHRVVRHLPDGRIVTRGDANAVDDDPVDPSRVTGEVRLVVPLVGLPRIWITHGQYVQLVLACLLTWAALIGSASLVGSLRDGRRDPEPTPV